MGTKITAFSDHLRRIQDAARGWLIIWATTYIGFMAIDLTAGPDFIGSAIVKYIGMALLLAYIVQKFPYDNLLASAFFATLVADFFLMLVPNFLPALAKSQFFWGVICFIVTQGIHTIRLATTSPSKFPQGVFGIYAIALILGIAAYTAAKLPPDSAIMATYATVLSANVFLAWRWWYSNKANSHACCAALGLSLFFISDGCIAIQPLLQGRVLLVVSLLVWALYYPAQVLIANSSSREPATAK
jgi:hypothetical protein